MSLDDSTITPQDEELATLVRSMADPMSTRTRNDLVYGMLPVRVSKYMTSVPNIALWTKNTVIQHDINKVIIDIRSSAALGVAQALHDAHVPYSVIIAPGRDIVAPEGTLRHTVITNAESIRIMDLNKRGDKEDFAGLCDRVIILPDCDMNMLASRDANNKSAFGKTQFKVHDYEDFKLKPMDASKFVYKP